MSSKSKAAGVSASSFWDLKSELVKQQSILSADKASGKRTSLLSKADRPDKKETRWSKPNKGVNARAAKDSAEWARLDRSAADVASAALERKAKVYEKLRRGQTGGMTDKQVDELLVNFDEKALNDTFESDSDDVDESLTVPTGPDNDDPIVEYEDEFGRIRTARKSEVPREFARPSIEEEQEYDPLEIRGPMNHFPTYEPSADRIAAIQEAASEANNPLASHYDATKEVRAKAAGFYQFSADEEERQRQLEELKQSRDETALSRQAAGAIDLVPGEGEPDMGGSGSAGSRALEKRKRDLEERRKAIAAKRRKVQAAKAESTTSISPVADSGSYPASSVTAGATPPRLPLPSKIPATDADDFLARLEQDMIGKSNR